MSAAAVPYTRIDRTAISILVRTGLLIGVVDGLWAVVLTTAYHRSVVRLFQSLAATPFGDAMLDRGTPALMLGVFIHFCVAFMWSAVFLVIFTRSSWLRGVVDSPYGVLKVAVIYGPMIWFIMSMILVPLFTHRLGVINYRWLIQAAGHVLFVGVPIIWSVKRGSR